LFNSIDRALTTRDGISAALRSAGINPSKRLGQNFLTDRSVVDSIVTEVRNLLPARIVEIGPGLGTVTHALSDVSEHVLAIEIDRRLAELLTKMFADKDNVEIRRQDFLAFSFSDAVPDDKVVVVGNIPYRITAPILKHLIAERENIRSALLLTQREVADKIVQSPGKDGTSLGVLVQAYADVRVVRHVPRGAFHPVPQVDSTLWKLTFLPEPRFTADAEDFFAVVRALYGHRRKMIRRALRDVVPASRVEGLLERADVSPTARGETLSFQEINRIAQLIKNEK
jgi:16S rRNA (adenine1518-N6/adenine1519-N6)-dimethyltransferase